jgi:hypothetical protein
MECKEEGCRRPSYCRGLCNRDYQRWLGARARPAMSPCMSPSCAVHGMNLPAVLCSPRSLVTKTSLIAGVTEGCEVESGAGEEASQEAGPVLYPPEPGLDQGGELGEVAFGQVGQ